MHRLYTCIISMLLVLSVAAGGPYRFQSLTMTEGLSSGSVNCMLIDTDGFLWIGTDAGLDRYDGYEVDTVIQFEGDQHYMYRILRSIKNRFGSTSELGIYEMQQTGLRQVSNPSELLLTQDHEGLSGIAISSAQKPPKVKAMPKKYFRT